MTSLFAKSRVAARTPAPQKENLLRKQISPLKAKAAKLAKNDVISGRFDPMLSEELGAWLNWFYESSASYRPSAIQSTMLNKLSSFTTDLDSLTTDVIFHLLFYINLTPTNRTHAYLVVANAVGRCSTKELDEEFMRAFMALFARVGQESDTAKSLILVALSAAPNFSIRDRLWQLAQTNRIDLRKDPSSITPLQHSLILAIREVDLDTNETVVSQIIRMFTSPDSDSSQVLVPIIRFVVESGEIALLKRLFTEYETANNSPLYARLKGDWPFLTAMAVDRGQLKTASTLVGQVGFLAGPEIFGMAHSFEALEWITNNIRPPLEEHQHTIIETALLYSHSDDQFVYWLLDHGANPNALDYIWKVHRERAKIVRLSEKHSPLSIATEPRILKILHQRNASLTPRIDPFSTLVELAFKKGHLNKMIWLISVGAPNIFNQPMSTQLALSGPAMLLEYVLSHGASIAPEGLHTVLLDMSRPISDWKIIFQSILNNLPKPDLRGFLQTSIWNTGEYRTFFPLLIDRVYGSRQSNASELLIWCLDQIIDLVGDAWIEAETAGDGHRSQREVKSSLWTACSVGDQKLVERLLTTNINLVTETALLAAIRYFSTNQQISLNIVDCLFDAGIRPTIDCLILACDIASVEIVRKLLVMRCDPNQQCSGRYPIVIATITAEIEILTLLLEYGADPNVADIDKNSPFIALILSKAPQQTIMNGVEILIRTKCNPTFTKGMKTARKLAETLYMPRIAIRLKGYEEWFSSRRDSGRSPSVGAHSIKDGFDDEEFE